MDRPRVRHPAHEPPAAPRSATERAAPSDARPRPRPVVTERTAPTVRLPPVVGEGGAAARAQRAPGTHRDLLLVLTALAAEEEALARALPGAGRVVPTPSVPFSGLVGAPRGARSGGPPLLVLRTGLGGGPRGADGVAAVIEAVRPAGVLSVGFAGGLDPALAVGDVVVGDPVVDPALAERWWPSGSLAAAARAAAGRAGLPLHVGPLLSVGKVEATPAAKAAAAARTRAVAVDMESAGIARAAAGAGVPFLALRVISDAAADTLPADAWRLVSPDGRAPLHRALGYLLCRPAALPVLVRTGLRAARAARVLAALLAAWEAAA